MFLQVKICVSVHVGKSFAKYLPEDPCRKNDNYGYIWHRSFIQMVKLFIKVSMVYRSRLVIFFQGKVLCFGMHQQVVWEVFIVWTVLKIFTEKMISLVLFETNHSFKQ